MSGGHPSIMTRNEKIVLLAVWLIGCATVGATPETNRIAVIQSNEQFHTWALGCGTTFCVYMLGRIPWMPRPALPLMAPLIGYILGSSAAYIGGLSCPWTNFIEAGALAVFIRETWTNLVTKRFKKRECSKTNAEPSDGAVAVSQVQAAVAVMAADEVKKIEVK